MLKSYRTKDQFGKENTSMINRENNVKHEGSHTYFYL